jgi:hexosaminidase
MPRKAPAPIAPVLIPVPRSVELGNEQVTLARNGLIVIQAAQPTAHVFAAETAQQALRDLAGLNWPIHAGPAPVDDMGLVIHIDPATPVDDKHRQAYVLSTLGAHVQIQAIDASGALYGVMTLIQLLRQYGRQLPRIRIEDYPDFARRGVMLDISRDKVPTMDTLRGLVDLLASLKINELQLYTEHTFAFRQHPEVWANASPMTGEELLALDRYCRDRAVDLVPSHNCFGHMRRWLTLPAYRDLAEAPDGCDTRWGRFERPFTLNPGDPRSIALVKDIFDEVLPHFTSRYVNVGCDETIDLGEGRSREVVQQRGAGRVYLDFLLKVYARIKPHNRTMQFWGDILMEHPELVPELPRDLIALEWGYEADHPFKTHSAIFANSGIPFYVCPGTSSWNSISGRTENMLGNILSAASNGLTNGAIGLLNTDWGDNGHLQPLVVSYLGYAFGAAVSWALDANRYIDLAGATSRHVFFDSSGATGRVAFDLGNVYTLIQARTFNGTPYGNAAFRPLAAVREIADKVEKTEITAVERALKQLERQVKTLKPKPADAALIKAEFVYAIALMRHGMARIVAAKAGRPDPKPGAALFKQHRSVWLARNRPGGLTDSADNLRLKYDEN